MDYDLRLSATADGGINDYNYVGSVGIVGGGCNPISCVDLTGLACFNADQFASDIEQNRFDLGATAGTLGATLGVGTMPKMPGELRGLGVPRSQLNPFTSQLSRWAGRTDIRALRDLGRTAGGIAAGTVATGATISEGFYDWGVIGKAAWESLNNL